MDDARPEFTVWRIRFTDSTTGGVMTVDLECGEHKGSIQSKDYDQLACIVGRSILGCME